jgi:hypothetical protein
MWSEFDNFGIPEENIAAAKHKNEPATPKS